MSSRANRLHVIQVAGTPVGGGAERIALTLYQGLKHRGHHSYMAVGKNPRTEPDIFEIPDHPSKSLWSRILSSLADDIDPLVGKVRGTWRLQRALRMARNPHHLRNWYQGRHYFEYPGTSRIPDLPPHQPDIIHCHNLHGEYFDLRQLAMLSRKFPLVMTLHDEWAFTGHCAYTLGCERWRTGCGACPDLNIYPPIRADATAGNWRAKEAIYSASRLFISTPSQWLMERVQASMLVKGCAGSRVIHNGVDRTVFHPSDPVAARRKLGLPVKQRMLLFTANAVRRNMFKDYPTVAEAARRIASLCEGQDLLLVALGDTGPTERFGLAELRFVPYESDPSLVAAYYQAADIYLHAAKADNFPTTILEALATGTPVVATAVGGIPEQIRSLSGIPGNWGGLSTSPQEATGVLVPAGDPDAMAQAVAKLLSDEDLRARLASNAAMDAEQRFDLNRQIDATIEWYKELVEQQPL